MGEVVYTPPPNEVKMQHRIQRIMLECVAISNRCGEVGFDDLDGSWVWVKHFLVPPGLNRKESNLLIILPAAYPSLPPTEFYLDEGLDVTAHYGGGRFERKGWTYLCLHIKHWKPTADIWSGDNLFKVVETVREFLTRLVGDNE
jgi:hypothetical protein